jgi:hypothetical protein
MTELSPPAAPAPAPQQPPGHAQLQRAALRDLLQLSQRCTQEGQACTEALRQTRTAAEERCTATQGKLGARLARAREQLQRAAAGHLEQLDKDYAERSAKLGTEGAARLQAMAEASETAQAEAKQRYENATWVAESIHEAAIAAANSDYRTLADSLSQRRHAIADRVDGMEAALRRGGHQPLTHDPAVEEHDPALHGDPGAAFHRLMESAEQRIEALGALALPRWCRGWRPWLVVAAALAVCVAGGYGLGLQNQDFGTPLNTALLGAGVGLGLALLIVGTLWLAARNQVRDLALPLRRDLALARIAARKQLALAKQARHHRCQEAQEKRRLELERVHGHYDPMLADLAQRSAAHQADAQEALAQDLARLRQAYEEARRTTQEHARTGTDRLTGRGEHLLALATARRDRVLQQAQTRHDQTQAALQHDWTTGQARIGRMVEETAQLVDPAFRDWDDPSWATWKPPTAFPEVVRFGRLEVDLKQIAGKLPRQGPYSVALPPAFSVPALLGFRERASMLLETGPEGRAAAIDTLRATMVRLLTALPPGRVRFTLIDPVGLGQSFAGFMHLTDYDEQLVGPRIWTEPDQVSQRLADLTTHMENVIQKYLRNEFETIDQYNAQAGELAEPYRFVVIADFPHNFGDDAIHRVASILSSGARCGVYCLIALDQRQALPGGAALDDLRARAIHLVRQDGRWVWRDPVYQSLPLRPDPPPGEEFLTGTLQTVGEAARASNRVEVDFGVIAPNPQQRWTRSAQNDLTVPIGRCGATRQQVLRLGKGVAQHVLMAGKTGSGKSTLLHVLVTNLALWYPPDEVEFYLIDFKKGVEFKTYASHRIPHARAVAIESDREFALSVLARLDEELTRRGTLFRDAGVQELAAYRQAARRPLPRVLLIVDEYQEFFSEDDKIAQDAGLLLDRLVRQGRAFGIHVVLGSQTLAGTSGLARSTIGQISVRIALQCSEADSQLILADNNGAARLLSRPGEAIYNDAGGSIEGNSPFQVAWLADETRDRYLAEVERHAAGAAIQPPPTIVFEGNTDAEIAGNAPLAALLAQPAWRGDRVAPRVYLGEAVTIKDPTAAPLPRQSGANLLIIGQHDQSAAALLAGALVSLAAQQGPSAAQFWLLDGTPADAPWAGLLPAAAAALPHPMHAIPWRQAADAIAQLAAELARRTAADQDRPADPDLYLLICGLQRYRVLRKQEDNFSFSSAGEAEAKPQPDKQFAELLREGPALGIHTLVWIDTPASLERALERQTLREFDHRVLFQMSATDSSNLIDTPIANHLGFHRALYFSEEQGILEKFRPYAPPAPAWLAQLQAKLAQRA